MFEMSFPVTSKFSGYVGMSFFSKTHMSMTISAIVTTNNIIKSPALSKFERVLEVAMKVLENMLKELRSQERYQLSP